MIDRNFGVSNRRIVEIENTAVETNSQKLGEFKPYSWLKDMGLPIFIPEPGTYTFDVLQFPMDYSWHLHWADNRDKSKRIYDMGKNFSWWEREVHVHECFPKQLVCKRTFGLHVDNGTLKPDPVCNYAFSQKNIKFRDFTKKYTVQVIRMYPNNKIGNTDYQLMIFPFKYGNFAKTMYEEYEIAKNSGEEEFMDFSMWNESGCSVKARFTTQVSEGFKKKDGSPATFLTCDRIDFVERKDQLTDEDIETICNLHVDKNIILPEEEEYEWAVKKYQSKYDTVDTVDNNSSVIDKASEFVRNAQFIKDKNNKPVNIYGDNYSSAGSEEDCDSIPF